MGFLCNLLVKSNIDSHQLDYGFESPLTSSGGTPMLLGVFMDTYAPWSVHDGCGTRPFQRTAPMKTTSLKGLQPPLSVDLVPPIG